MKQKKKDESQKISQREKIKDSLNVRSLKWTEKQKQFILEGFPGIGPVISKKLLNKYKTLKDIFSLSNEELSFIERFDDSKIKKFRDVLES